MTLTNEEYRNDYDGTGSTTVFPIDFKFLANAEILVVLTDAADAEDTLILDTDYTVTGAGDAAGGDATLAVAPAVGETLTIVRNMPITQSHDYVEHDNFPAESHETALDRLTMLVQQLQEEINRASTTSVGAGGSGVSISPSVSENLVAYDGAGGIAPSGKDLDEVAVLDGANEWTAQQTFVEATLTDQATIAWNVAVAQVAKVTLGANRIMGLPTNIKQGGTYELVVIQDGIGSRTITWNAAFLWEGGTPPVLADGIGETTILSFYSRGSELYGSVFWKEQ